LRARFNASIPDGRAFIKMDGKMLINNVRVTYKIIADLAYYRTALR
jgi:hypothetical protein